MNRLGNTDSEGEEAGPEARHSLQIEAGEMLRMAEVCSRRLRGNAEDAVKLKAG